MVIELLKKFWAFLQKDTWQSFVVTLILAFIIIKFIFFPGLSLITGTQLPLVIVESCSMHHHEFGFEKTFTSTVYSENDITLKDTINWAFQDGFSKGDVIFVIGANTVEEGDVIIFNGGATHPLIHRVVNINAEVYGTKGDNYKTNAAQLNSEKHINPDQVIGKALFRVPAIGWIKLIFFEGMRPTRDRGLCS